MRVSFTHSTGRKYPSIKIRFFNGCSDNIGQNKFAFAIDGTRVYFKEDEDGYSLVKEFSGTRKNGAKAIAVTAQYFDLDVKDGFYLLEYDPIRGYYYVDTAKPLEY